MTNLRITVRFNEKERATIEKLVQQGKFKNISQVIKAALKEFLSKGD
jgi:Arc/MetJ-type ribon-helix-helix transcriptional regulator